jgi:hypothetical protein
MCNSGWEKQEHKQKFKGKYFFNSALVETEMNKRPRHGNGTQRKGDSGYKIKSFG